MFALRNRVQIPEMLWVALCLALTVLPATGSAGNLDFLKDAPITRFTGQDRELFESNLYRTLDQGAVGEVRRWQNPKTGSDGDIIVVKNLELGGKPCRHVRISNRAKGYTAAQSDSIFCKNAEGKWSLTAPTRPPATAPVK